MPTAKKPSKRSSKQTSASDDMRSFRAYPGEKPFFNVRINQQTFYWLVICLLILALGMWTLFLTMKIQHIYDKVDMMTTAANL